MKKNIIVRFWMVLLLGASFLNVQCAGKKVMFKGIVANYSVQDSVELYDALGRQKAALEKAAVEKGVFKFYYNPVEIGYYIVHFSNGKNVLCVHESGRGRNPPHFPVLRCKPRRSYTPRRQRSRECPGQTPAP